MRRKRITHGMTGTNFMSKWKGILRRCENTKDVSYSQYGAKGIKCSWNNFSEFHRDMYESYVKHVESNGIKNTTIDRINSKGDYSKENCRWATYKEQTRNYSRNRFLTYKGKTLCLTDWALKFGLKPSTLNARIFIYGWELERAFMKKAPTSL